MFSGFCLLLVTSQTLQISHGASTRYTRNPSDTAIVYPGPIKQLHNRYGNEVETPLTVPNACKGKSFCTIRPPDYPQEKFSYMFKGHKQVSQVAWVPPEGIGDRQGDPTESDGCETVVTYEPLYQVKSKGEGDWRTVIQSPEENFVQRVRLEECKNTKKSCFNVAGDLGIETFCKQKYNVWEVLVSDGNNGTERIKTELPVCCSCHYRI